MKQKSMYLLKYSQIDYRVVVLLSIDSTESLSWFSQIINRTHINAGRSLLSAGRIECEVGICYRDAHPTGNQYDGQSVVKRKRFFGFRLHLVVHRHNIYRSYVLTESTLILVDTPR